jgi:hypothetical protein
MKSAIEAAYHDTIKRLWTVYLDSCIIDGSKGSQESALNRFKIGVERAKWCRDNALKAIIDNDSQKA